jgi:RNA polymerase sigma-70 factor, ECF subfamily
VSDSSFHEDIHLARQGGREALDRVLTTIQARMRSAAENRIGTPLRAKMATSDLLQSTYVDVVRSIKDFEGNNERQLMAWVTKIMDNNLRDRLRFYNRQRRNSELNATPEKEMAGRDATPSFEAMQIESLTAVGRALSSLPDDQRQIMQLRVIEGREYEEIAKLLDKSVGSLRMLLSRARAALTVRLDQMINEP